MGITCTSYNIRFTLYKLHIVFGNSLKLILGFPSSTLRFGETILEKCDNFESSSSVNCTAPLLPDNKSCFTEVFNWSFRFLAKSKVLTTSLNFDAASTLRFSRFLILCSMINIVFCMRSSLEVMFAWDREKSDGRWRHDAVQNERVRDTRDFHDFTTHGPTIGGIATDENTKRRRYCYYSINHWRKCRDNEKLQKKKKKKKNGRLVIMYYDILFTRERCAVTGE
ncbi:hypothetical protein AGLY_002324 [Aphis glycines]|uniref:Uncharacterized protein n=1 Tax=Aphis glycines TaxID=307491 RepID=A0A6G0U370_APHGL|nr:hypothetical protein AGLY_002324 [Aphis glycines]